ncbi:RPA-related protein RADX isoform X4 [Marmota marmota marmota]|uniref:RPA-related protein RADX isoform X4 n=1 Tax=Marmota marmota marmota TaxID=9994 RepID=UPI0020922CFC|nr:RPA-related protein RADX isoform X4 [Marmota marmota marmota]
MPENHICDVIGMLAFVGRVQRSKKKENREDFWSYRWIHIADGTSEQPFIVELFSTSQPEIFENIYPMTYFVCTQLKVVRNDTQVPKLLYLTTTNESRVFITGHRGQPYTYDTKVKNFIQWIKTKTDSGEMKNTVIGGYYPYPPVPETFSKYSNSVKVESLLTAISEVRKEIEDLQYREQKRIAIQGIITVIKYIPHGCATESASASETLLNDNQPSTSQAARDESHRQERDGKWHQDDRPMSPQCFQSTSASLSPSKKRRILQGPYAKPVAVPQPEVLAQTKGNKPGTSSFFQKHRKFLTQQYNSQPAKYVPPEGRPPKLDDFMSARSLGHFEVTILGLNHEIAIDVAFLPMYCPEDVRTSQIDTLLTCMNYSCVYPPEVTVSDRFPGPRALASDIIRAATELDRVHIIGILDICNLGNNKVEVYLQKIYSPENTS